MARTRIDYFITSAPTFIGEDTIKQDYEHIVDEYRFVRGEHSKVKDENKIAFTSAASTTSSDVQNVPNFLVKNKDDENVEDVVEDENVDVDDETTNTSGPSSEVANNKWTCGVCGKVSNSPAGLRYHKKTHSNIRPFSCVQCVKTFVQKSDLVTHEKTHTGVKEYECATCHKTFLHKSNLTRHEKIHRGVKEHICGTCGREYIHKFHLTAHIKTHTGIKKHICLTCNKMFLRKYHLTAHVKIHSGIKDFVCGICNKAFIRKSQLNQHLKSNVHKSTDIEEETL